MLRDSVSGSEIKTKKQQICHAGEFLVAEIDAKVGGFGIVPESLEGAIVSSHYFLFKLDEKSLDRRFLDYFIRTRHFRDQVTAQGSTNYAAIRPEDVLGYMISLPPLDEQRRIVARIEELAARIEEARELRRRAEEELGTLKNGIVSSILCKNQFEEETLGELLREPSLNGLSPRPSEMPLGTPILRISAATSRTDAIVDEMDFRYLEVNESDLGKYALRSRDLLACRFNGNLNYVGRFALYEGYSHKRQIYPDKLIRFRLNEERILPKFALLAINSSKCRPTIESFCATTAGNIGVSAGNLKTVKIPVPPLDEQSSIVTHLDALQSRLDALKRHQAETADELDALMPSILDKAFNGEL